MASLPQLQQQQQPILPHEAPLAAAGPTLPARGPYSTARPAAGAVPAATAPAAAAPAAARAPRPAPQPAGRGPGLAPAPAPAPPTPEPGPGSQERAAPGGAERGDDAPGHAAAPAGAPSPGGPAPRSGHARLPLPPASPGPARPTAPMACRSCPTRHGAGMASAGFPGAQGFPPTPPHMHPHQLPMQMSFPAGPPNRSPLPGQRGHFMPPGSPTGLGRQSMPAAAPLHQHAGGAPDAAPACPPAQPGLCPARPAVAARRGPSACSAWPLPCTAAVWPAQRPSPAWHAAGGGWPWTCCRSPGASPKLSSLTAVLKCCLG